MYFVQNDGVRMRNSLRKTAVYLTILTVCSSFLLILFSLDGSNEYALIEGTRPEEQLPEDDRKLFDLDLRYTINNEDACTNSNLLAVILVTSFAGNVETRSAMRRAITKENLMKSLNMTRIFLLADATRNKYAVSQKALFDENRRFGDLVQGNFMEAYRNLTYKHVMGLKWVSNYCRNVRYVIKMDDDTVVNMHKMAQLVQGLQLPAKNALAGYVLNGMIPIREPANKWYVTRNEFPYSVYPTFVSGWFYITTPEVYRKMALLSAKVPYFWIDDVYVTGILAKMLKVRHYNIGDYFSPSTEFFDCCMRDIKARNYDCDVVIGPNGGDNNLFYTFNKVYAKCLKLKCRKRPKGKSLNDTCVAAGKINLGRGSGVVGNYQLF